MRPKFNVQINNIILQCPKHDIGCQVNKFISSLTGLIAMPPQIACHFQPPTTDRQNNTHIRGSCKSGVTTLPCQEIPVSSARLMCLEQCQNRSYSLNQTFCYRSDLVCQCQKN